MSTWPPAPTAWRAWPMGAWSNLKLRAPEPMALLSFRFAAREMRSGVRGFRIFMACLALGVAAIAAAGSTAEAFRRGLASQASEILDNDLALTVRQRQFNACERAILEKAGRVSYSVASMAMSQAPSGERRLIELR